MFTNNNEYVDKRGFRLLNDIDENNVSINSNIIKWEEETYNDIIDNPNISYDDLCIYFNKYTNKSKVLYLYVTRNWLYDYYTNVIHIDEILAKITGLTKDTGCTFHDVLFFIKKGTNTLWQKNVLNIKN